MLFNIYTDILHVHVRMITYISRTSGFLICMRRFSMLRHNLRHHLLLMVHHPGKIYY